MKSAEEKYIANGQALSSKDINLVMISKKEFPKNYMKSMTADVDQDLNAFNSNKLSNDHHSNNIKSSLRDNKSNQQNQENEKKSYLFVAASSKGSKKDIIRTFKKQLSLKSDLNQSPAKFPDENENNVYLLEAEDDNDNDDIVYRLDESFESEENSEVSLYDENAGKRIDYGTHAS